MRSKHPEFALWAADVKKIDVGLLPKLEEKELFRSFIEDFNTGMLALTLCSLHVVCPSDCKSGSERCSVSPVFRCLRMVHVHVPVSVSVSVSVCMAMKGRFPDGWLSLQALCHIASTMTEKRTRRGGLRRLPRRALLRYAPGL